MYFFIKNKSTKKFWFYFFVATLTSVGFIKPMGDKATQTVSTPISYTINCEEKTENNFYIPYNNFCSPYYIAELTITGLEFEEPLKLEFLQNRIPKKLLSPLRLNKLHTLIIKRCFAFTGEGLKIFPWLRNLTIRECNKFTGEKGLFALTNLHNLTVEFCKDLKYSRDELRKNLNLDSLIVKGCYKAEVRKMIEQFRKDVLEGYVPDRTRFRGNS